MESIGRIKRTKIYYIQVRGNSKWKYSLPKANWMAVTIANKEDEELIPKVVKECIEKKVLYSCSLGDYAGKIKDYFDEEMSWLEVEYDRIRKKELEYSLVTTVHVNFREGFLHVFNLVNKDNLEIDKIVCIDLTKRNVKNHLIKSIENINNDWIQNDSKEK